jgi:hypothetical protein
MALPLFGTLDMGNGSAVKICYKLGRIEPMNTLSITDVYIGTVKETTGKVSESAKAWDNKITDARGQATNVHLKVPIERITICR